MSEEIIEENHPKNVLDDNLRLQMDEFGESSKILGNETNETSTNPDCLPVTQENFVHEIPNLQSSTTTRVPCKGFIKKVDYFDTSERLVSDIVKRFFWSTSDSAWFSVDCQGFTKPDSNRSLCEACRSCLNNVGRWRGNLSDSVGIRPKATTQDSLPHPNTPHIRLNFSDAQTRLNNYSQKIKSLRDQIRRQHVAAIRYSIKNTANDIKISKSAENNSIRNVFLSVSKLDNLKDIMKPMIIGLIKKEHLKKTKNYESEIYMEKNIDIVKDFVEKITISQKKNSGKGKGVRYSSAIIRMALSVYNLSPASYRVLLADGVYRKLFNDLLLV